MPQGVGHIVEQFGQDPGQLVRPSLMPQGVEHVGYEEELKYFDCVQPSLMPQGVEHETKRDYVADTRKGAILFDAARR